MASQDRSPALDEIIDGALSPGFVDDVTDRMRAEEASRRLAAIVESTDDGVVGATIDGIVTGWNRGAQRLFGWASHEAVGRPMAFLVPPEREGEERGLLDAVRAGRAIDSFATRRMRRDGSRVDVSVTYSLIRGASGSIEGVSAILREIAQPDRSRASDQPATDQLTGVLDDRELHRRLDAEIARFEEVYAPFTVLLVEVEEEDDELARRRALRTVAGALAGACRADDPIYRNGPEGFAVLLQRSPGAAPGVKSRVERAVGALALDVHVAVALAEWPYDGPRRDRFLAGAREGRAVTEATLSAAPDVAYAGVAARHGEIASVRALLAALVARDGYTGEHSEKVVSLASDVARSLSLDEREIDEVEQVALLHDIGKIGIPDSILRKDGPLNATEWEIMREHPEIGAQIVAGLPSLAHLAPLIRAEHERWDGHGYPRGLAGDQAPLPSRIILACDAYQSMTTDRPYRRALPVPEALREFERNAGSQFDPSVVACLLRVLERRRHGAPVLANRRTAKTRWRAYLA